METPVLVDSNVILDLFTLDYRWVKWSQTTLLTLAEQGPLIINPIIYAEVSANFMTQETLDQALPLTSFRREAIPFNAAYLAGKAYQEYRKRGGPRLTPLPDFFIGAHAVVSGYRLLTRDQSRYRTYFPSLKLICPQ